MKPILSTKYQSINDQKHINHIFNHGTQIKYRTHYLYFCKRYRLSESLCIITSRKVGNAIKRNRCRRQVRAFFSIFKTYISKEYDIIVVVHSNMVGCSSKDIYKVLINQLKRQGIWND